MPRRSWTAYSLISSTTRIETASLPPPAMPPVALLTDFQHNKDWNRSKNQRTLGEITLTHWFPAQQGLKQSGEYEASQYVATYSLISSTTRIETCFRGLCGLQNSFLLTDFQHNKDWNATLSRHLGFKLSLTHWFPAQQGLKQFLAASKVNGKTLTHWFPAQQGLKHSIEIQDTSGTVSYSLISSTTRIET